MVEFIFLPNDGRVTAAITPTHVGSSPLSITTTDTPNLDRPRPTFGELPPNVSKSVVNLPIAVCDAPQKPGE